MSIGAIIAIIVLLVVVVAMVFAAAAPAWLPMVLIGMLALAVLLGGVAFPLVRAA